MSSAVLLRNNSDRRRELGGARGPKSTETNKSKSVTRYQQAEEDI